MTAESSSSYMWFIVRAGAQHGPIPDNEFRSYMSTGALKADDMVWRAGFPEWKLASEVLLAHGLPPPIPATPQPPRIPPVASPAPMNKPPAKVRKRVPLSLLIAGGLASAVIVSLVAYTASTPIPSSLQGRWVCSDRFNEVHLELGPNTMKLVSVSGRVRIVMQEGKVRNGPLDHIAFLLSGASAEFAVQGPLGQARVQRSGDGLKFFKSLYDSIPCMKFG